MYFSGGITDNGANMKLIDPLIAAVHRFERRGDRAFARLMAAVSFAWLGLLLIVATLLAPSGEDALGPWD